jgi:hypothetical protein
MFGRGNLSGVGVVSIFLYFVIHAYELLKDITVIINVVVFF